MNQKYKVHYPKRKRNFDIRKMKFGIPEPARKNMYDIVKKNLKLSNRKTFLHRFIYIGQYFPAKTDQATLEDLFNDTVKETNEGYCIEKLTGLLILYTGYFIHILEGDEDSIHSQLGNFLNVSKTDYFGKIKGLIWIEHIHKRLLKDWSVYIGYPQKLLGTLDTECSQQEAGRQFYLCVKKISSFLASYSDDIFAMNSASNLESTFTTDYYSEFNDTSAMEISRSSLLPTSSSSMYKAADPYKSLLPETEVLDFVLNFPDGVSLEQFHSLYGKIPQRDIYKDRVWPIAGDFMQYDILSRPYEMIIELPKPFSESCCSMYSYTM